MSNVAELNKKSASKYIGIPFNNRDNELQLPYANKSRYR